MSKTTTINPSVQNSGSKGKKFAGLAAGVGAAGVAAAGVGMASAASPSNDETEPEPVEEMTQAEVPQETVSQTSHHTNTANHSPSPAQPSHQSDVTDHVIPEPQPVTIEETAQEIPEVENVTEEVETQEVEEIDPLNPGNETPDLPENTDTVNPDEIADAIIAEEMIDPEDIDMADVINFDEIGTVYTLDGESYTAAAFHDTLGNELMMVDIDGDDAFDVIIDHQGNVLAEVPGVVTVDDAELATSADDTYLAHSDTDHTDSLDPASIVNDLIS